jgi:hypothetical protein
MAIDKKILKQYQLEITSLQKSLSTETFNRVLLDKLMDFISKNPPKDIYDIKYELRRIYDPIYSGYVTTIFSTYDKNIELVNTLYKDLGVDVARDMNKVKAIEKINASKLGIYRRESLNAIASKTREAIINKLTLDEQIKILSAIDDKVSTYAETIATTQTKGYGQELKNIKANLGEVFYYEYVGIIRSNTRPFCRNILTSANKTFHIDEINAMENGVKQIKPVRIYGGGWNCHHNWEPDPFYKG